jgi:hypothetical protein
MGSIPMPHFKSTCCHQINSKSGSGEHLRCGTRSAYGDIRFTYSRYFCYTWPIINRVLYRNKVLGEYISNYFLDYLKTRCSKSGISCKEKLRIIQCVVS